MNKTITIAGTILIIIAIILGALVAHELKKHLNTAQLTSFETGVRYAMYHGLAFLVLGLNAERFTKLVSVYRLLLAGVILFSGSIFLLNLQDVMGVSKKFLGPVTPLGGVLMIIGWIVLTVNLIRKSS